jgi:hypothetical protein
MLETETWASRLTPVPGLNVHRTCESESHELHRHWEEPRAAMLLRLVVPKFRPFTVIPVEPELGALRCTTLVAIGESNEKMSAPEPTRADSVSLTRSIGIGLSPSLATQLSEVPEVHDEERHTLPWRAVGLMSRDPKLLPHSVTGVPPDDAAFRATISVIIGASNVQAPMCVPIAWLSRIGSTHEYAFTSNPLPENGLFGS